MPSAARTRAHRVWTVRTLRTSRRTDGNGGWVNWRLRSERRLINRNPSSACLSPRPMASSGRWASQGAPISPLLANLYRRWFVLAWKQRGLERSLGSRIVNYADDLVILCKRGKADEALLRMREIMGQLKLTVNEEKTRVCKVPEETFDFLGFTFGRMYSMRTGQARLGYRPSKSSIQHMVRKIHVLTAEAMCWQETTALVSRLNRMLRGWANYFQVGAVSRAYRASTATPRCGCVGGYATSTRSGAAGTRNFLTRTSTRHCVSYVYPLGV